MMSTPEPTKRVTRSSTRSQTENAQKASKARQNPAQSKSTGRVNKPKPKPKTTTKAKAKRTAASSAPKSTAAPAPKHTDEKDAETGSTPSNVTTSTLTSELVKNPITYHTYAPLNPPSPSTQSDQVPLIFTHGAGGTLSAPAVTSFCSGFSSISHAPVLAFQGSMNLGARVKGFHACRAEVQDGGLVVFGGRSMGARAAVIAATETLGDGGGQGLRAKLVLVSYPLQGPKDVRDRILLDLPAEVDVLFIVGDGDAMCPLELLEEVRGEMSARNRVVVVKGADHGMNIRPKNMTRWVGEGTGRVAARWLSGEIEVDGEVMYVGEED